MAVFKWKPPAEQVPFTPPGDRAWRDWFYRLWQFVQEIAAEEPDVDAASAAASHPGIDGLDGSPGPQGASGGAGSQGPQGNQGAQGAQGSQGTQGNQGFQGNQGSTGPAPTGTGYVHVTSNVLDTPSDDVLANSYSISASAIVTESGTSKTLASTDNGKVIYFTSGSSITLNMAALSAGFSCIVIQGGAGQVTFNANSQTMTVVGGFTKTNSTAAMATIIAPVANTFFISGALA